MQLYIEGVENAKTRVHGLDLIYSILGPACRPRGISSSVISLWNPEERVPMAIGLGGEIGIVPVVLSASCLDVHSGHRGEVFRVGGGGFELRSCVSTRVE